MQLKLSLAACGALAISALHADNYVSIQYLGYDEENGRTYIHTPAFEFNVDIGADYTLNATMIHDSVSGASPTYYDASSGASATLPPGTSYPSDIVYGDIPYEEERYAVGVAFTRRFESRDELTLGFNYSNENDYLSKEVSVEYLHYTDPLKNRSVTLGASYQKNDVEIYCFMGTDACDAASGASGRVVSKDLDAVSVELGFAQVLDRFSLAKASLFVIDEEGYLSNPYLRVVRNYATSPRITEERKPDSRRAYGFTLEYDKSFSEEISALFSYRFYDDDWDITSHTFDTKLYYDWEGSVVTGLAFRGYTQSAADFFSGKRDHFTDEKEASSDRRVSAFDSYDVSVTLDYRFDESATINMGFGYYDQPEYFHSIYYNVGMRLMF